MSSKEKRDESFERVRRAFNRLRAAWNVAAQGGLAMDDLAAWERALAEFDQALRAHRDIVGDLDALPFPLDDDEVK